jgi:hypothetical protein
MKDEVDQITLGLTKAFKSLQMYGMNHSSFRNFYMPFYEKMSDFLKIYNQLSFQIGKFTMLQDNRVVYKEEEMDLSIAFRLFKDGVRNIEFNTGLTSDELLLFLDVLSQPGKDFDVALGLWECDFSHISFYVVEEEEMVDYRIPDVPVVYIDYDEKLKQLIMREKIDIDAVIIPDLKPNEVKSLMNSMSEEEKASIIPMVITTLTDFLHTDRSQEVIEGLIEILESSVNRKDFYSARRIAYKLRDYPEIKFLDRFENAATIMGFMEMLNVTQNELFNDFLAFIGFFSKKSIPFLMELLPLTERSDRLHALRHRIAYIAQDDPNPVMEFLKSDNAEVILNTVVILGIMKASSSAAMLEPLVSYPDKRVRVEVIEALGNMKKPAMVVKFLMDPSQEARIKALRLLGKLKYPQIYSIFLDKVKSKDFLDLEYAEKREYFNYLTANADHHLAGFLKDLLFKRKWFGRKKYRDMRRLAATALSQMANPKALEVLQMGVAKRNKDIRSACEIALKEISS